MSAGPLRRITAAIGLIALVPVALLLAMGGLSPEEAVLRAGIVLVVVVLLGSVARLVLTRLLRRVERRSGDHGRAGARGDGKLVVAD